jgi:hypothetical protein
MAHHHPESTMAQTFQQAVIEMAYDNGVINRLETEESVVKRVMASVKTTFSTEEIERADIELTAMSKADFDEFLTGETELVEASDFLRDITAFAFDSL